ncbi:DNA-binding protein RFX5 isoform X2 [Pygocentrus nattereri]|uniref:DNA-binding protein RFX5 isoform X2 n=1 Tax=Pygocentrus nattereri TaxID=42514 RepID=UPI001890B89B|nr:DNA-binding protein RFX5 isoform X2 [Pygocentrus nattereri]
MESSGSSSDMQAELRSVIAELQRVKQSMEELSQLQTRLNAKRTSLEAAQQVPHWSGAGDVTSETAITSTTRNAAPGSWRKRLLARVAEVNYISAPDSSAPERPRCQQRRCSPPYTQPEVTTTTNRFKALSSLVLAPPSLQSVQRRRKNTASVWDRPRRQKPQCFTPPPQPEVTTTTNSGDSNLVNTADQLHTCNWIRSHLEEHADTCLPKQDVYETYRKHCENLQQRPLSAANFGKIIRDIFPNIKARRLGGRGQSKYCYSGIRRKTVLNMPLLPNLDLKNDPSELTELVQTYKQEVTEAACELICDWAQKILKRSFDTVVEIARFLVQEHIVNPRCSQAELVTSAALAGGPSKPHKLMKKITATPRASGAEDDGSGQDAKKDKDGTDQVSPGKQQLSEKPAKGSESSRSGGRDLQVEALMKMKKFPQILPRGSILDKSQISVHSSPPAFTPNDSSSVKVTLPITVTTLPAQQGLPVVILPSGVSLSYPEQDKSTSVTVSTSAAPTPVVQRARAAPPKRGPDPISAVAVAGPGGIPPKRKRGRPRKPRPEEMTPQPPTASSSLNPNPALVTRGVIQKALSSSASIQSTQVMEIVVQEQPSLVVSPDVRDSEQRGVLVKCQNVPEPEAPPILLLHSDTQPGSEISRAMVIQRAPISLPAASAATLDENREVQGLPVEAPPTSSDKEALAEENPPPPQAP